MAAHTTPLVLGLAWLLAGCGPSVDEQAAEHRGTFVQPSRLDFPEVGHALQLRCGTMDCHGQVGRNLRLYGYGGLRRPTATDPIIDTAADPTTPSELDASFESLSSLEPEVLSRVASLLADPAELTVVRKPRGTEKHKGGALMLAGDPLDLCLTRWLMRSPVTDTCLAVTQAPRPGQ